MKHKQFLKNFLFSHILGLICLVFLTACSLSISPDPTEVIVPAPITETPAEPLITPTPQPSPTPTLPPLGTDGNPITIGFVLTTDDPARTQAAQDIAFLISRDTGYAIESLLYPDFQTMASAVLDGEVDLFWLAPFEYLYLNWEGAAQVVLMTNHQGIYAFGVQFLTNINSGFASYYDHETNQSTGEAITALQQFSGTRPCFLNPHSIPGNYVPLGLLNNVSTPTRAPVHAYSYNAIIRALYIEGICDFGVSYALTGDPLTSGDILQNLPEAQEQVVVIWQSEGIIPNTNLSASPSLPTHILFRIQEAVLQLPDTPEGLSTLSTALNYEVEAFRTVEDSFYNPLRSLIIPLTLDLEMITSQPPIQ